jgi:hypothetical protein
MTWATLNDSGDRWPRNGQTARKDDVVRIRGHPTALPYHGDESTPFGWPILTVHPSDERSTCVPPM